MNNSRPVISATEMTYGEDGLITAVCQHYQTAEVLMVAFMNAEAFERTLTTKQAWFWSRSRSELWNKGATSGNRLLIKSIRINCDNNTILMAVEPSGPTCHTGNRTCFFRILDWSQSDE